MQLHLNLTLVKTKETFHVKTNNLPFSSLSTHKTHLYKLALLFLNHKNL